MVSTNQLMPLGDGQCAICTLLPWPCADWSKLWQLSGTFGTLEKRPNQIHSYNSFSGSTNARRSVQLTQHRVRDEKKDGMGRGGFTADQFHMAYERSRKTAQRRRPCNQHRHPSTPAPDTSHAHEIKLDTWYASGFIHEKDSHNS